LELWLDYDKMGGLSHCDDRNVHVIDEAC